ncbi:MAG: metallophosphoesterase [Pseudomonadota bacterium]
MQRSSTNQIFKIAHISDLHLLSLQGVSPLSFVNKRVLGGLNLLIRRSKEFSSDVVRALIQDLNEIEPDHVIVSGDLTNLSFPGEFELARDLLGGLRLPPTEITVVPGNHDCYTRIAALKDDFGRVFGPFFTRDFIGDNKGVEHPFPFVRVRGDVAIFGLNTARPSLPLLAVGTVGANQLEKLEALLARPDLQEKFQLVVMHHPPKSEYIHWHNRLTDAADFAALINEVGADLIVHGHLHRGCKDQLPGPKGPVRVIGVGSGAWLSPRDFERRAQYHLYEITGRTLARIRVRRLDEQGVRFRELAPVC